MGNNITCSIYSKYRIAATLHTLKNHSHHTSVILHKKVVTVYGELESIGEDIS
jgi:hypothetical protein